MVNSRLSFRVLKYEMKLSDAHSKMNAIDMRILKNNSY